MLALSDEAEATVKKYVQQMELTLTVGAEFTGGGPWGVSGFPSATLVNGRGVIVWEGHPGALTPEIIESALVGAKVAQ